jgi:hypothetical protein
VKPGSREAQCVEKGEPTHPKASCHKFNSRGR